MNDLISILNKEREVRLEKNEIYKDFLDVSLIPETSLTSETVFRKLGVNAEELVNKEKARENKLYFESLHEKYHTVDDIIHYDDIEKIAIKYNLKFLNAEKFKVDLSISTAEKIAKYCKLNNTTDIYRDEYFILSNPCNFSDDGNKKLKGLLMHKLSNGYYKIIDNLGNMKLDKKREVGAWKFKSDTNFFIDRISKYFIFIYSFIMLLTISAGVTIKYNNIFVILTSILFSLVVAIIRIKSEGEYGVFRTTRELFDINTQRKNPF